MWMKQLEEDCRVPCDMMIPPHVNGTIDSQEDCSASYVVREGYSVNG